jgi:hypothetical protein
MAEVRDLRDGSKFTYMKYSVGDIIEDYKSLFVVESVEPAKLHTEDGLETGWRHTVRPATEAERTEYYRPATTEEVAATKAGFDAFFDAIDN